MPYVEAAVRREQFVAAARTALARDGVAGTSLRAVAAEAGVPLGTLQYVFPSKAQLLAAVIEDLGDEIAAVLRESATTTGGLAHALREGLMSFWSRLVGEHWGLQLMQYELTSYALRSDGQQQLARRQYERYTSVVTAWCEEATATAGETPAVPCDQLARLVVAGVDGLILQHVTSPDAARSQQDLAALVTMVVALADVR
ncbi:TetR/AcrR family transcriptional regulator [Nocardioides panacisoli]|uniref:TetR/AcrR family transcriptional regulator n=1 Tax=Nocardioides panacisoli TaxID=627624 RepID=UPI001C627863|nr:TetR/AcrR family transcriptional regulator [Nocardioides panacisoli]QYJ03254.1 TetR/AcrR family transcriptional regulator [Nocardioides panacisoli]